MRSTTLKPDRDGGKEVVIVCHKPRPPLVMVLTFQWQAALLATSLLASAIEVEYLGVPNQYWFAAMAVSGAAMMVAWLAWQSHYRIKPDAEARERFERVSRRLPAISIRVIDDEDPDETELHEKFGFRIAAQFRGTDGNLYEAYSNFYRCYPGDELDVSRLHICFDAEQPLQSRIHPMSAPPDRVHRQVGEIGRLVGQDDPRRRQRSLNQRARPLAIRRVDGHRAEAGGHGRTSRHCAVDHGCACGRRSRTVATTSGHFTGS